MPINHRLYGNGKHGDILTIIFVEEYSLNKTLKMEVTIHQ